MGVGVSLTDAVETVRRRPGLLVVGAVWSLLDIGALFLGFVVVFAPKALRAGEVAVVLVAGLWFHSAVLTVLRPAVLPTVREFAGPGRPAAGTDVRAGVRTLSGTWRRRYRDVFVAGGVGRGVALAMAAVGTILLVLLALVVGTAAEMGLYAVDLLETPDSTAVGDAFLLLPLVAVGSALLLTGFAELRALDGAPPTTAWVTSVRRARGHPVSLAGYAIVRAVLSGGPVVAGWAAYVAVAEAGSPAPFWIGFAVFLVTAVPARAVDETLRVRYYDRVVSGEPLAAPERIRDVLPRPRLPSAVVLMAGVLLVAAVAGAGAIRVTDVRPNPEPGGPPQLDTESASASSLYERAIQRTRDASRNVTGRIYDNASEGGGPDRTWRFVVDYPDRETALCAIGTSFDEACEYGPRYFNDGRVWFGSWNHVPLEYDPEAPWRVVDRTDTHVILGIDDPSNLSSLEVFREDAPVDVHDESRARAWIRTEDGRFGKIVYRPSLTVYNSSARDGVDSRVDSRMVIRFDYTHTNLHRPELAPEVALNEFLRDLVYY